jgi:hypothetical protein
MHDEHDVIDVDVAWRLNVRKHVHDRGRRVSVRAPTIFVDT